MPQKKVARSETELFAELAVLVRSPGYVHAIAHISMRDVMVTYARHGMKASDLEKLFSPKHLIRTEINTLLGLLARGPIDASVPSLVDLRDYIDRTDRLLQEFHDAMSAQGFAGMFIANQPGNSNTDVWRGDALREPIFYGGESAYSFQYRDLAVEKYAMDAPWLIREKGFDIAQAQAIAKAMCSLIDDKATLAFTTMRRATTKPADLLWVFEQKLDEISQRSGVAVEQVHCFFNAFTLQSGNDLFRSVGDFNGVNATPLLAVEDGKILLFQHYAIYEALYETPFYWMIADKAYRSTASKHRGAFTERFAAKRLAAVFGKDRVHANVKLVHRKGASPGEIDVLVVFGNRLIVLQAKSKKLTLEARRGNDGALRKDFAGAIQDSFDQAWLCAEAIVAGECKLVDSGGTEIVLPYSPKELLIFNLVSDHYPALAFQARQFLQYQTSEVIRAPFVMDVFLLDALVEMLDTPLRLISYAKLRVNNIDRITLSHELTALGLHLKRNLWLDAAYDMVLLEDSIAIDLDVAMTVRREKIPGPRTPEGILTRLSGTLFERLVEQIESQPEPATIELGLHLLELSEETGRNIHRGLEVITTRSRQDDKPHDFAIGGDHGGISFHCNPKLSEAAAEKLRALCELRKYEQRAPRWFGVSVDPNAELQFGVVMSFDWVQSEEMDAATAGMQTAQPAKVALARNAVPQRNKVGRNDPCPCGSGSKFKKCCLGKLL